MPRRPRAAPAGRRGAGRKGRDARRQRGPAAAQPARMQKLLSAAGIGSRREVERWIREGRLRINGELPALGATLGDRDRVTLDGRPVRVHAAAGEGHLCCITARRVRRSTWRKRPRGRPNSCTCSARGRWLAIQAVAAGGRRPRAADRRRIARASDLARPARAHHRLRHAHARRAERGVGGGVSRRGRVRREAMSIVAAEAQQGAGQNHWLNVTARATRRPRCVTGGARAASS